MRLKKNSAKKINPKCNRVAQLQKRRVQKRLVRQKTLRKIGVDTTLKTALIMTSLTAISFFPGIDKATAQSKKAQVTTTSMSTVCQPDLEELCFDPNIDIPQDRRGCALDGDGDQVVDHLDRCLSTPAGTKVDLYGCKAVKPVVVKKPQPKPIVQAKVEPIKPPAAKPKPPKPIAKPAIVMTKKIRLDTVNFDLGTANLKPESFERLDAIAVALLENPELRYEVAGHTDNQGGYQLNKSLSLNRAKSVMNYLIKKGVDKARLAAKGYGPDQPVADNQTREGRRLNRRVELHQQP